MDWPNKIALFVVGLFVFGVVSVLLGYTLGRFRQFLNKIRQERQAKRAYQEALKIKSGEVDTVTALEYLPQPDGGMILRFYKDGVVAKDESYTAWEWEQHKKVINEMARRNVRPPRN